MALGVFLCQVLVQKYPQAKAAGGNAVSRGEQNSTELGTQSTKTGFMHRLLLKQVFLLYFQTPRSTLRTLKFFCPPV